jgi:hypothetical protein
MARLIALAALLCVACGDEPSSKAGSVELAWDAPTTCSNNVLDTVPDPFVSYPADLHLRAASAAGATVGPPYDRDLDGRLRGADGHWDIGAYEYGAGPAPAPAPPTNLRLTTP